MKGLLLVRNCRSAPFALLFLAVSLLSGAHTYAAEKSSFSSPEDAVNALIEAVRSGEPVMALREVLGPSSADLIESGDPIDDAARRAKFLTAYDEAHAIELDASSRATLVIGKAEFPFPIPIVAENGKWRWDADAGLDEVLTRRIGENELSVIEVMRAYVAAQQEYAERDRDGKGAQYARRLMSNEGKKDGLYWPTRDGEEESPIGSLIAEAQAQGYVNTSGNVRPAYHGYVYRMLYGQGHNAAGGQRDYIVKDRMIGGFALIATPVSYGKSGVMTFIVSHEGIIYEKDLGPQTSERAMRIKFFDPDKTWRKVPD